MAGVYEDHQVGYGGSGDRISGHNAIWDMILSAAQCAAFAPSRKMPNLVSNSLPRPADIFLPSWSCDHPAALDVHVISPLQQQTLEEAATNPGHALQVDVKRKLSSHLQFAAVRGLISFPLWLRHWVVLPRTPNS